MKKRRVCASCAYIFILIIYSFTSAYFLYSCKKEPAKPVSPGEIMRQISESGIISLRLEIFPLKDKKKLGQEDFLSLYGEKDFDVSSLSESAVGRYETEDMIGEAGIFKLLDKTEVEKYRGIFTQYIADMQKYYVGAGETAKAASANDGEVRDYGNYVYYAVCEKKDKVFEIIESALGGK